MPEQPFPIDRDFTVESPAHPFIKFLKSLALKKHRQRAQCFFAEGLQSTIMALDARWPVSAVVYVPSLQRRAVEKTLLARCRAQGLTVVSVSERAFRTLSDFDQPSGVGVLAAQQMSLLADLLVPGPLCLLALEEIQYAGNLGTILRTCDAAGVQGVVLLQNSVDVYSPQSVRASMGCIFTQRVARSTAQELMACCNAHDLHLIAATPEAGLAFNRVAYPARQVLLLGSERYGLSAAFRQGVKTQVAIPMRGQVDSLNVAVAAAILMYQALAQ